MALDLSAFDRELVDGAWRWRSLRHAPPYALRRSRRCALVHRHRGGAYRWLSLSWTREPRLRRTDDRTRRQGSRADNPQCRLGRPYPSRALSRNEGACGKWSPTHACACRARVRAHLYLRPLSNRLAPAFRRADRLGRIERDRVRQFGDWRAHQSLWRFYRPLLRH